MSEYANFLLPLANQKRNKMLLFFFQLREKCFSLVLVLGCCACILRHFGLCLSPNLCLLVGLSLLCWEQNVIVFLSCDSLGGASDNHVTVCHATV